jgi:hypothetical protein
MQLLIVHHDPEMGEALVQMVQNYTRHHCSLVSSYGAAMDWARGDNHCDLLLTQLETEEISGLALGSALSEVFAGLQVLFFPSYADDERCLEVSDTKIFPEPIVGDELLAAIERAEESKPNTVDVFQVVDILQMCCLSRLSGAVQMVKDGKSGLAFLGDGKIVHADTPSAQGRDALAELVRWKYVEFAYEQNVRPPSETISEPWNEILMDVVMQERDERKPHLRVG